MRGLVLGQLRQVHQHPSGAPNTTGLASATPGAGIAGRQVIGRRSDGPPRSARLGVGDGDEPQIDQPPVMREPDRVGRIEREARGRQTEGRRLAPDPASISARRQRRSASSGGTAIGNSRGDRSCRR